MKRLKKCCWPLATLGVVLLLLVNGRVVETNSSDFDKHVIVSVEGQGQGQRLTVTNREDVTEEEQPAKTCIRETGLNFTFVSMVNPGHLVSESLSSCVRRCSGHHKDRTHVLISYSAASILGDTDFICACAEKEAMERVEDVSDTKCNVECPGAADYRCGNFKTDILSVYCLYRSCLPSAQSATPVCRERLPHDSHGCLAEERVDWQHAHNVRNFSLDDANDETACVWECHDNHPLAMFSLTRRLDNVLTCSCAYPRAFDPTKIMRPEFCSMLDEDDPFYTVNCIHDLDEDPTQNEPFDPSDNCTVSSPLGCIYEELLLTSSSNLSRRISIRQPDYVDPYTCQSACAVLFPESSHVAVRWDDEDDVMECLCALRGAFGQDRLGPDVGCNQTCGAIGTGFLCGSPTPQAEVGPRPPMYSLYCVHSGLEAAAASRNESVFRHDLEFLNSNRTAPLLEKIHGALKTDNVTNYVLVGLLTLLALVLLSCVTYFCFSNGIAALARHVM